MLEAKPARHDRLHARGLRRLRRRRLRPRPRHGRAVRHVLRRRPERVQLDRRRVRREVARGDDHRLARPARADPQSAAAPHGAQLPHAVRRVRKAVRRRHRAERSARRRSARSTACWPRAPATSGRCTSRFRATWSTCGPQIAPPLQAARAAQRHAERWPKRSTKRSSGSRTPGSPCCCWASKSIASACRTKPCDWPRTRGIPMAATMLGKGVVAETHPLYMGLYEGALGREEVTQVRRGQRLRR